jgi:hypothetical protein
VYSPSTNPSDWQAGDTKRHHWRSRTEIVFQSTEVWSKIAKVNWNPQVAAAGRSDIVETDDVTHIGPVLPSALSLVHHTDNHVVWQCNKVQR